TPMDSNISAASWTLNGKVASPGKFTTNTSCATGTCEDRYTSTTYYNNNNAYYCAPDSASSNNYVGCYYNWYSATASSGTSSITPVGTSTGYKDVNSSICPKGWYLPTGGGVPLTGSTSDRPNSDFNVLYNNYPSASEMLVSNPTTTYDNTTGLPRPGLLLSGNYYAGGADSVAQYGNYWSRSAYSKGVAYNLYLNSSAVHPQGYGNKYYGRSVRCVAY
ncbi:MAG: FISUMP domain-containing protein, partial [Candidatus Saccharibacteria bacterium]|nr:FISUMP domain-containing protein [Candidatus Saccharibacteria bacterium]